MKMHYALKFNPKVIQDLKDEDELDNVVSHGDDIVELPHVEAIEENKENCVSRLLLGRYMVLETHVNEIWDIPVNEKNITFLMYYILFRYAFPKLPFNVSLSEAIGVHVIRQVHNLIKAELCFGFSWAQKLTIGR